jgi:uncharacterized membrane protein
MLIVTSSQTSSSQPDVDAYLTELRSRLGPLPAEQVNDIVEEIRSHIHDRATDANGRVTSAGIQAALNRLGPASALAATYVTDNLLTRAQRDRKPWTILHAAFRWAMLSVKGIGVFLVCVGGYALGASFLIAALVKPFNPKVGLWLIDHDTYSLVLGMTDAAPHGHELLGWRLVPLGLAIGGGTILLTTHFAQWFIRKFRETIREPFHE